MKHKEPFQNIKQKPYNEQKSGAEKSPYKKQKKQPRPPKKITEQYLHNAGLYYLQRFAASSGHFKTVMMRKIHKSCAYHKDQDIEACKQLLDRTVDKFLSAGLLDDSAYARAMVTSLRRRGLSSKAITVKLRAKSMTQEDIKTALEEYDAQLEGLNPDLIAALRLCQRKRMGPFARDRVSINNLAKAADEDQLRKQTQRHLSALARAGFSYEISKTVLDMPPSAIDEYGFVL